MHLNCSQLVVIPREREDVVVLESKLSHYDNNGKISVQKQSCPLGVRTASAMHDNERTTRSWDRKRVCERAPRSATYRQEQLSRSIKKRLVNGKGLKMKHARHL